MSKQRILILTSSHDAMGDTGNPTGVWIEELATPYYAFTGAGYDVDIASIAGGKVPVDPKSLEPDGKMAASAKRFFDDNVASQKLENSMALADVEFDDYDALFLPGGHGTMWDLPADRTLASGIESLLDRNRIVAAVCHGPAGLLGARRKDGKPVVSGLRISAFSNSEEESAGLTKVVPFLLESKLRELGARYEKAANFEEYAVRDRQVVTGQNPASAAKVAELVIESLRERSLKQAG